MVRGNYDPRKSDFVLDNDTPLGKCAEDETERRTALDWCLNKTWANKEIGRVDRIDNKQACG